MALVLVYDFLFGRGLQVGGQLKQVINRNKTGLQAALARMKVKAKVVTNEELLPQTILDQQGTCFARRESSRLELTFERAVTVADGCTQPKTHRLKQVCCRLVTSQSSSRYQDAFASLSSGLMTTSLLQVVNRFDAS